MTGDTGDTPGPQLVSLSPRSSMATPGCPHLSGGRAQGGLQMSPPISILKWDKPTLGTPQGGHLVTGSGGGGVGPSPGTPPRMRPSPGTLPLGWDPPPGPPRGPPRPRWLRQSALAPVPGTWRAPSCSGSGRWQASDSPVTSPWGHTGPGDPPAGRGGLGGPRGVGGTGGGKRGRMGWDVTELKKATLSLSPPCPCPLSLSPVPPCPLSPHVPCSECQGHLGQGGGQ